MEQCDECKRAFKNKNALATHVWRTHTADGKEHGLLVGSKSKGRASHRKGLTKETSEEIRRITEKVTLTARKKVLNGTHVPAVMGAEARLRLSKIQSLHNRGGKCKWFSYRGAKLQGTWELKVAKKLDELGVLWYKPHLKKDIWSYVLDGKVKSYTPDFYLPTENIFLEIKGYWWGDDRRKMEAVATQHQEKRIVIVEKDAFKRLMRDELVW